EERTKTMSYCTTLRAGRLWVGVAGIAAILCIAPGGKTQEVNPDHFTDNGVDGVWPRSPAVKKTPNTRPTVRSTQPRTKQLEVQRARQFRNHPRKEKRPFQCEPLPPSVQARPVTT